MKMGADALVLVIAHGDKLSWSKINQMVGRGCRSFGVSKGIYYTTGLHSGSLLEE